jgi:energy-coupling factor transporter ATP-binding protein EcfA2
VSNFRCFENHTITFNFRTNLLVGKNNAGKSTVIEALRVIGMIVERMNGLHFQASPGWLADEGLGRGVAPSIKNMDFGSELIFHRYDTGHPVKITAVFQSGASVVAYIGPDFQVFGVFYDSKGRFAHTKSDLRRLKLTGVAVLPQIRPLENKESILTPGTISKGWSSNLASSHFRNQLNTLYQEFSPFKELSETTWHGLQIQELAGQGIHPGEPLYLHVRDGDFVAEIQSMGHGLQMWLQMVWFLCRSKSSRTIILDEPDVYLHADLQRKLIRVLKSLEKQVIIATHSVEMMAEVQPNEIIIVDKKHPKSSSATSLPIVQQFIDTLGGIHNLHLARLWHAKKCILVEGNDLQYLKEAHGKLFPESETPFDTVPNYPIGGWNGWQYAIGSQLLSKTTVGDDVILYCILDSDYHLPEEIAKRQEEARKNGISLHIWEKKEIENYFLIPAAISRFITEHTRTKKTTPSPAEVEKEIDRIVESMKPTMKYADAIQQQEKKLSPSSAASKANAYLAPFWKDRNNRWGKCSGKEIFAQLSAWSQQHYKVSLNAYGILKTMTAIEIDPEMKTLIEQIEKGNE